jgi:hypothetical protein
MTIITEEQIRTAAREVFDEVDSGFTYRDVEPEWAPGVMACTYTKRGEDGSLTSGCIVGRIMHKCGISLEMLNPCDGGIYSLYSYLKAKGIILPESLNENLMVAQIRQDGGGTWHGALIESELVVF